jgi:GntR family transcriptional repressor for pyruvate dehydrogenase complex
MLTTIDIAQRRLPELIAEQIAGLIRETPLQPGERLPPETSLARQLGVGRTSVREALQKLQTLGLIEVVRGRGVFVSEPTIDDGHQAFARWSVERLFAIEDLLETRMTLEASAAALACGRASADEIETLEALNLDHLAAARSGDLREIVASDEKFHESLIAASHNKLLAQLYGMLVAELTDFRRKTLGRPDVPRRSAVQHAAIVAAIRNRDHRAARRATIDHLWVLYEEVSAAAQMDAVPLADRLSVRDMLV